MLVMQLIPIYMTLLAVFTTLNYYAAVAGGIDFGTTGKQDTLLAAFSYTVTHATLGAPPTAPQSEWAIVSTAALRLCTLVLLIAATRPPGQVDTLTENKAAANATST